MSHQVDLDKLVKDLDYYFEHAVDNDERNALLAQSYMNQWGDHFETMSIVWVIDHIRQDGDNRLFGDNAPVILNRALNWIGSAQSLFLIGNRDRARAVLISQIKTSSIEDVIAMAAFLLASRAFASEDVLLELEKIFPNAVGTSCKMSLAYALHCCGNSKEIIRFLDAGYFGLDGKHFRENASEFRKKNPAVSEIDAQKQAIEWLTGLENPEGRINEGVFFHLVLDIASNGKFFSDTHPLPWTRKRDDTTNN